MTTLPVVNLYIKLSKAYSKTDLNHKDISQAAPNQRSFQSFPSTKKLECSLNLTIFYPVLVGWKIGIIKEDSSSKLGV